MCRLRIVPHDNLILVPSFGTHVPCSPIQRRRGIFQLPQSLLPFQLPKASPVFPQCTLPDTCSSNLLRETPPILIASSVSYPIYSLTKSQTQNGDPDPFFFHPQRKRKLPSAVSHLNTKPPPLQPQTFPLPHSTPHSQTSYTRHLRRAPVLRPATSRTGRHRPPR